MNRSKLLGLYTVYSAAASRFGKHYLECKMQTKRFQIPSPSFPSVFHLPAFTWNLHMAELYKIVLSHGSVGDSKTIYMHTVYLFHIRGFMNHCWPNVESALTWDRTGREFDSCTVSDIYIYIYPMFIEPTITWVSSGFSGYIWLNKKLLVYTKIFDQR